MERKTDVVLARRYFSSRLKRLEFELGRKLKVSVERVRL